MSSFKQNTHGTIFIDEFEISLADFLIEEPGYVSPAGMVAREYFVGGKDLGYTANFDQSVELGEDALLDGYISNLATYKANIQARENTKDDSDYAPDLALAKVARKKQMRGEAAGFFRTYEDSDLELTQPQLSAYRTDLLVHQNTVVAPEIDALTTITAVREYENLNWPPLP